MGYDLHITRKQYWADEEGEQISHEDWQAYVETDPEVIRDSENSPTDYLYRRATQDWPLWWAEGEVLTKNPEQDVVLKMAAIAKALGATLQGDDGEQYDEQGNRVPDEPASPTEPTSAGSKPKPWWRFW